MGYGDRLAGGSRSAVFSAAPKITQERWDKMWEKDEVSVEYHTTDANETLPPLSGETIIVKDKLNGE